jgi:hypothetical protein
LKQSEVEMNFLVIFGAFLALCFAKPSVDLGDEASGDNGTDWGDGFTTEGDFEAVTSAQESHDETSLELNEGNGNPTREIEDLKSEIVEKNRFIEQQSKSINEKSQYKNAENVAILLGLVQINKKIEKNFDECEANLTTKVDTIQQLETAIEDLKQQIKAKEAESEKQTKSIEEYKNLLANSADKAKKIQKLSTEIIQAQPVNGTKFPTLTIGESKQSSFPMSLFDFLLFPGSKQFFLQAEKLSYVKSKEKCKTLEMEIASFDSRSEAQQVFDAVVNLADNVWVGMERHQWNYGEFVNMKGEIVKLPWAAWEPNNSRGNENCVEISKDRSGYNDVTCGGEKSFVCQKVEVITKID